MPGWEGIGSAEDNGQPCPWGLMSHLFGEVDEFLMRTNSSSEPSSSRTDPKFFPIWVQLPRGSQNRTHIPWNRINPSVHSTKASAGRGGESSGRQELEGTSTEQSRNQLQALLGPAQRGAPGAGQVWSSTLLTPGSHTTKSSAGLTFPIFWQFRLQLFLKECHTVKGASRRASQWNHWVWEGPEQHSLMWDRQRGRDVLGPTPWVPHSRTGTQKLVPEESGTHDVK